MSQTKAQLIAGTSSQDVTFDDATVNSLNGGPLSGARNRIINGDMRIDQRNAGASVTVNGNFQHPVDRFLAGGVPAGGTFTAQRSTVAPAGFSNSLLCTVTGVDSSLASGDYYFPLLHKIEGFNVADLAWGTAAAASITVSFWCRGSVTGTYAVACRNSVSNRSYIATFSISSANTWEYKTVVIPGDQSGAWLTNNESGIELSIGAISGTTAQGTAGSWSASNTYTTSSCVNWMATNGATFYITGVQLEAGTVATPFERRSYGQELALCQRYYEKSYNASVTPGTATTNNGWAIYVNAGTLGGRSCEWRIPKRTSPSVTVYSTTTGASGKLNNAGSDVNAVVSDPSEHSAFVYSTAGVNANLYWHTVASAEL